MQEKIKEYTCTTEKGTLTVYHYAMKFASQMFWDSPELNYQGQEIEERATDCLDSGKHFFVPAQ